MKSDKASDESAPKGSPKSELRCKACEAEVLGKYCHVCGQKHRQDLPRLRDFFKDSVLTVFESDGPVPRTLVSLFCHPGELSRAYHGGVFAPYISPIRLFIVASAIYFLLSGLGAESVVLFATFGNVEEANKMRQLVESSVIFLLPFFGLILMLVRFGSKKTYICHLVSAVHIQSLWFLFISLISVVDFLMNSVFGVENFKIDFVRNCIFLICIIYLILELKFTYAIPWYRAVVDGLIVITLYSFSLMGLMAVMSLIRGGQ